MFHTSTMRNIHKNSSYLLTILLLFSLIIFIFKINTIELNSKGFVIESINKLTLQKTYPFGQFCFDLQEKYEFPNPLSYEVWTQHGHSQFHSSTTDIVKYTQQDPIMFDVIRKNYVNPPPKIDRNINYPQKSKTNFYENPVNLKVESILKGIKNGFFVDSRAYDGEENSNTLLFEMKHNWTGILIEPSPSLFGKLLNKKRHVWTANLCVSPNALPARVQLIERTDSPISRILGSHDDEVVKFSPIENIKSTWIDCFSIFTILSAINVTTVDFFNLEVDGFELDVLRTIPLDLLHVKVFSIKYNSIPEGPHGLQLYMTEKNYSFYGKFGDYFLFTFNSLIS